MLSVWRRTTHPLLSRSGRPGAGDVGVAGGAEAPGAVYGFGDSDSGAGDNLRSLRRQSQKERLFAEVGFVVGEVDSQGLGQLSGAVAEVEVWLVAAAGAHLLDAVGWFQGSDQDGGCLSFGFGYRVEEAVDSVGEVDVGVAGRAE
jgi:hypothetical protein